MMVKKNWCTSTHIRVFACEERTQSLDLVWSLSALLCMILRSFRPFPLSPFLAGIIGCASSLAGTGCVLAGRLTREVVFRDTAVAHRP